MIYKRRIPRKIIFKLTCENNSPQQQFENANFVNSELHKPVTTESGRVPSPTGLPSTIVTDQNKIKPNLPDYEVFPFEIKNKTWGNISHASFCNIVNGVYDEIVHYRRNTVFNVPSGRAGKSSLKNSLSGLSSSMEILI